MGVSSADPDLDIREHSDRLHERARTDVAAVAPLHRRKQLVDKRDARQRRLQRISRLEREAEVRSTSPRLAIYQRPRRVAADRP